MGACRRRQAGRHSTVCARTGLLVAAAMLALGGSGAATTSTMGPRTTVVRPLPGSTPDFAASIAACAGGFVLAGYTETAEGDQPLLVRVDSLGGELWRRTIRAGGNGAFWSARVLDDGSIVAAGWARNEAGDLDALLSRFGASGELQWRHEYRGPAQERLWSIEARGNELLAAGEAASRGGATCRALVLRADLGGTELGRALSGRDSVERVFSVVAMDDGGYVLAGLSGHGPRESAGYEARITRYDAGDRERWTRTWGGPGFDVAHDVHALPDGGLLVAAYGFAGERNGNDAFLLKLDAAGKVAWSQAYGGPDDDRAVHAAVLAGGYALIGYTRDARGAVDCVLRGTDAEGRLEWERRFGGTGNELGRGVIGLPGGAIAAIGHSGSYGSQERILFMRLQGAGER